MLINLHTHHQPTTDHGLALVNRYANAPLESTYFSAGVHPWHVDENPVDWEVLESYWASKSCLAIGECGLDFLKNPHHEIQQTVFLTHIEAAHRHQKPLILHLVKAHDAAISLKKQTASTVPWIHHGFSQRLSIAQQLIRQEFWLSFGKRLFSEPHLEEVLRQMPMDKIFLETDTSDIPIMEIYAKAAAVLDMPLNALEIQIEQNFKTAFAWNG